jgi:pyrroloquinoline quinone biosynthesis protein B
MRVVVLGAAAGGGFPQWNSNAPGCRRARAKDPKARARTQASVAVSADSKHWFVLNASPDLRAQIEANPPLQPKEGLRSSPIAGVVLSNGDVDAIAGLLHLRERQPFTIYSTGRILAILAANPIFEVLAHDVVKRQVVPLNTSWPLLLPSGEASGLTIELFPTLGKVPLYLEAADETPALVESEDTVGIAVSDGSHTFYFVPSCAGMTESLRARLAGAELVFFDGTLWTDDEMIRAGIGSKTGLRMGHMSLSGPNGTMAAFSSLGVRKKILIHINNSNPVLLDDSPEREIAEAAGWTVAYDGMEVTL